MAPAIPPAKPEPPRKEPPHKEKEEARYRVDRNKIYFGSEKTFKRPAVIRADEIYAAIPSYRKIDEKGLTRDDPEYWPLMRKTTVLFVRALRKVCEREAYDLVAESGSLSTETGDEVPEITRAVIASLDDGSRRSGRYPEEILQRWLAAQGRKRRETTDFTDSSD